MRFFLSVLVATGLLTTSCGTSRSFTKRKHRKLHFSSLHKTQREQDTLQEAAANIEWEKSKNRSPVLNPGTPQETLASSDEIVPEQEEHWQAQNRQETLQVDPIADVTSDPPEKHVSRLGISAFSSMVLSGLSFVVMIFSETSEQAIYSFLAILLFGAIALILSIIGVILLLRLPNKLTGITVILLWTTLIIESLGFLTFTIFYFWE